MLVACILNLNVGCVYTKPKCWLCVYYRITGCSDQIFPTRVLTLIKLFHKLSHLDLYKGISSFGGDINLNQVISRLGEDTKL